MGSIARACIVVAVSVLAACTSSAHQGTSSGPASPTGTSLNGQAGVSRPNIVFILTDDLSSNLVRFMPNVRRMQADGVSFTNYTVTDSLCCPSRSSIFTGDYPHNTGVFTNEGDDGGFATFQRRGDERLTYNHALKAAGYTTAMMGKFLNGYEPSLSQKHPYVPSDWDEWDVTGGAYREFDYDLNENGVVHRFGTAPGDYLTDVLSDKGPWLLL